MSYHDAEAIEAERLDADLEMASLQEAGRAYAHAHRTMRRLRAAGRLQDAARACSHGWGYPLKSLAAANASDERAGQDGWRCLDCGSVLAVQDMPGRGERVRILFACEGERR